MSKVKSVGKIRYVEPNDFLNDRANNFDGSSYNITQPYEDYCIAVDLTVKVPNRIGSASSKGGKYTVHLSDKELNGSSVSFFGGTDGYLSSNAGSTTYHDIMNGDMDGCRESLGIKNIHIAYNSYFYPEVTINFTDVRGAALMMPHEENYRREQINKAHNAPIYTSKVENFFSSLFSFPYPEFILDVKGFYGKKVQYSLVVSDFRSSFNNETGNFDATVKFIGKMYGVYTDIPMSYLLIAPYCKYGSSNNMSIWEEKADKFVFSDGTPMPTLLDLKSRVLLANHEMKTNMSFEVTERYRRLKAQQNKLLVIRNAYTEVKNKYNAFKDTHRVIVKNEFFLFPYDKETKCSYLYKNTTDTQGTAEIRALYQAIESYNTEIGGAKLPFLEGIDNPNIKIGEQSSKITFKKITESKIVITDLTHNIKSGVSSIDEKWTSITSIIFHGGEVDISNLSNCPDMINMVRKRFVALQTGTTQTYSMMSGIALNRTLTSLISNVEKEIEQASKKTSEEYDTNLEKLLGFKPTIKNVFKIIMAHLECFTSIYSTFISNVTGPNARKLSDYGLIFNRVDIPNHGNVNDVGLPPFPAIEDNEGCFCYPSSENINGVMEETELIDALFDSTVIYSDKEQEIDLLLEQYTCDKVNFIPSCLCDLTTFENPYKFVFEKEKRIDWILFFFGMRCITNIVIEDRMLDAETFGKIEAYNFWRVNQNLKKDLIEQIKSNNFNSSNFLQFLLGKGYYQILGKPCYANTDSTKKLLIDVDGQYTIPGDFSFPVIIGRQSNAVQTFWDDTKNNRGIHSFPKRNNGTKYADMVQYRPTNFIKLVETGVLQEWSEDINKTDTHDICEDSVKKNLLEGFLNYTANMFNDRSVYYRKEKLKQGGNKYTGDKSRIFTGLVSLQEVSNNSFKDEVYLDSIFSEVKQMPVFLDDYLTAEDFLFSLPHNIKNLVNISAEGRCVITLPYVTKLFIGMHIKKMQDLLYSANTDAEKLLTYIEKLDTLLDKGDGYLENHNIGVKLLGLFTCGDNGERLPMGDYFGNGNDLYNIYKDNEKFFKVDVLNLIDEYEQWAESVEPGGFKYFKNAYSLSFHNLETIKTNTNEIAYKLPKKNVVGRIPNEFICDYVSKYDNVQVTDLDKCFRATYKGNSDSAVSDRYYTFHVNTNNNIFSSNKASYLNLSFNENFSAYKHLNELFKQEEKLIIPYPGLYVTTTASTIYAGQHKKDVKDTGHKVYATKFNTSFNAFKQQLLKLYQEENTNQNEDGEHGVYDKQTVTEEAKLSMYRTLKNLYDKHFATLVDEEDKYSINEDNPDCEFSRFHFIDTFYNDLGNTLNVNLQSLSEVLVNITDGYNSNHGEGVLKSEMSLYSFMALVCQKHNMMLMAMPVFNGSFTEIGGPENLETMFTPLPYKDVVNENSLKGPSYICFYPHQASQRLDIPNSQYPNDGFNIIEDINDTGHFIGATTINDLQPKEGENYIIPAFGVEYGSQKQSIFKSINVNMDNPQTTEISVANQFHLAQGRNINPQSVGFQGQDIYKIYSNYSFTCQVEMMGCAQIQPLMYFQLNNIPMFRGAYQIIQVEHNIVPGNMTTSFKGVRINKTKVPMVKNSLTIEAINEITNTSKLENVKRKIYMPNITLYGNAEETAFVAKPTDSTIDYKKIMSLGSIKTEPISSYVTTQAAIDDLNPELRNLLYSIGGKLKENGLTAFISSATRAYKEGGSKTSDHVVDLSSNRTKPSSTRSSLYGMTGYGERRSFDRLGCAVDLQGCDRKGNKDKSTGSVSLFHLIATEYTDHIRQLIWECGSGKSTAQNCVSHAVHLASYGKENNDKREIFVSDSTFKAVKVRNDEDVKRLLPPYFIKTLYDMAMNDKLNNVRLPNFPDNYVTKEKLAKLCTEMDFTV